MNLQRTLVNIMQTIKRREHIRLLVQEKDIGSPLKQSVCSRETCETTADDDNLSHFVLCGVKEMEVTRGGVFDCDERLKVALIRMR